MICPAVFAYVAVLVAANLIVAKLGPAVSPLLAFVCIGCDLALRDWLHVRMRPSDMLLLILGAGAVTFALNPAAGQIAGASAVAFMLAALADWGAFARLRGSWLRRAIGSNVAGAAVDSVVFPLLAFGPAALVYAPLQFVAKVAGGALWAAVLARVRA